MLVPFRIARALAFLPYLLWINIPGFPLAAIGSPFYDLQQFGALPKGFMGWALIVLFYVLAAFFLSLIGNRPKVK